MKHLALISLAAGLILTIPFHVRSAEAYFAVMDGLTSGTPSPGTGTATLILNDENTLVEYQISYSGLTGVEFASHIHNAKEGDFGPIVHTLPVGTPKIGTWALAPAEVDALKQGQIYINVHTDLYPGGEIRGNLAFQSVPANSSSWGSVKTLFR